MHSKIVEWNHHPLTKKLIRILETKRQEALDTLVNDPDDLKSGKQKEAVKIYNRILDLENLFDGELEETDE